MALQESPVTPFTGVVVGGVDLTRPGEVAEQGDRLRTLLHTHHVLVFRDQPITIVQQKALTRLFGPIYPVPYVTPMPGEPDVIAVRKTAAEQKVGVFGGDWHSDFSFLPDPPAGTVLSAQTVPPIGGDTVWANMVAAYEALPERLRQMVEGRQVVHIGKPYGVSHAPPEETRAGGSIQMVRGDPAADREILHPLVRVHPASGRKALFINPTYTTRIDGMSEADSAPILSELYWHCTKPEFTMRLQWMAGTVAVWDNRTTMHYAVNDYDGYDRLLYRTTFGEVSPVA